MTRAANHYELSLRCRRKAEQEFEPDDLLTAAEMMWGAIVHAIKFIAPRHTPATLNSHLDIKRAVPIIDEQLSDIDLREGFGNAEALHRYFYRVHFADHQVRNSFRRCQRLLDALLA